MGSDVLGAAQLAEAIASGARRSVDVVAAAIRRLDDLHGRTNCIAAPNAERALEEARQRDDAQVAGRVGGPLHGVPFTVKDWIDAEGLPCTGGWPEAADRRPARDATVVARLREAGGVLIAKTTVQPETELFGVVRNPHDALRSPGGSSSGEAVAVAGGASPLGLGSDSGGSIRLPAAWCGAAGYKPTVNCVPLTGHFPRLGDRADGRTVIGPLARRVEDLALAFAVIAGPDGIDPAMPPVALAGQPAGVAGVAGVRVAVAADEPAWSPQAEIANAVRAVAAALERRGARLVPPVPARLDEVFDITCRYWDRAQRSGADAHGQLEDWDRYRRRALVDAAGADIIVMPATRTVAPLHRAMERDDYVYTLPPSLSGWPAVVLPVAVAGRLPVAVQLVAKPWHDRELLAVASAVEAGVH